MELSRETSLAELSTQAVSELELAHPNGTSHGRSFVTKPGHAIRIGCCGAFEPVANARHHGSRDAGVVIKLDGTEREHLSCQVHNMGTVPQSLIDARPSSAADIDLG